MSIRNVSEGFAARPWRQNAYLARRRHGATNPARPGMSDAHGTCRTRAVSPIADTANWLSQRVTYRVNTT